MATSILSICFLVLALLMLFASWVTLVDDGPAALWPLFFAIVFFSIAGWGAYDLLRFIRSVNF